MSQRREGQTLSSRIIRKIELASGVIFGPMPAQPQPQPRNPEGFAEAEAIPFTTRTLDAGDPIAAAVEAMCANRNAADAWVMKSRALEAIGYQPGDILIVDMNQAPQPGDVVCANIIDWQRGGTETVFRVFQPPCLVAAPVAAGFLKPYMIDQNVVIKGTVIATLCPRRPAR